MLRFVLGGLAVLVLLGAGWIGFNWFLFRGSIDAEIGALEAAAQASGETVTEERLAQLPAPVARHIRQAGVVGEKIPTLVRLTQKGRIRSDADAAWMEFEAVETYSTNPPAFVWRAFFPTRALPLLFGRDHYLGGDGAIIMKLLGTIAVVDSGGTAEMNHAGLMRYLNETMWFPAALAGSNLTWQAVDDTSADVSLSDNGITASARLFFDAEGRLVNFVAQRFNSASNAVDTWETPIADYATFGGVTIPAKGSALFRSGNDPFTYIEAEITGVSVE